MLVRCHKYSSYLPTISAYLDDILNASSADKSSIISHCSFISKINNMLRTGEAILYTLLLYKTLQTHLFQLNRLFRNAESANTYSKPRTMSTV